MKYLEKLPMELIKAEAAIYKLPWDLVASIALVESSGIASAHRYEPDYRYLYFPRELAEYAKIPLPMMEYLQKTSWGLMQVMGAVAYERGLPHGVLPCALLEPRLGIKYGCAHLAMKLNAHGDEDKAISAYNQGSPRMKNGMFVNFRYVDKVYVYLRELRKLD